MAQERTAGLTKNLSGDLPRHIAIIMDGNGRWAKERGWPRTQGHLEGVKRVDEVVKAASDMGIKALTLYTFSTENWTRPEAEVSMLMQTLVSVIAQKLKKLHANGVRFRFSGRREGAPSAVLETFDRAVEYTRDNTGLLLNIAFNYGGRLEILDAVRALARECMSNVTTPEAIDEKVFSDHLYTKGIPDPDLLIRTSGEKRLSNFLLWQLSYAEFYFTDKYWPDFTPDEFVKAVRDYQSRGRRFGGVEALKGGAS
ncbi:MAG: isoprenyl transferase [Candidatus Omnitrophica bacterium]|nr:isoprenyl transferase [Candidatus Omnitrophota bacterium]